eukprot:6616798-Prymnesium_polylepis.1
MIALSLCTTACSSAAPMPPKRARKKEARTSSLVESAAKPEPQMTTVSPPSALPVAGATDERVGSG